MAGVRGEAGEVALGPGGECSDAGERDSGMARQERGGEGFVSESGC